VLGNHDYDDLGVSAYTNYFTLPENERYYDFTMGPVHFFMLDSEPNEPDGNTATSTQAQWLHSALAASTSRYSIVDFHEPAYSSGFHGLNPTMQWPFEAWGTKAVINGHDHDYERIMRDDNGDGTLMPTFISGLGGHGEDAFTTVVAGSQFRYNANDGALIVTASDTSLKFEFWSVAGGGTLIDSHTM
jgi:tartrate-resistant acid phosphatase type 5